MTSTRIEPTAPPTKKKKLLFIFPGILGNTDIDYINIKSHLLLEYNIGKWNDPRNGKIDIEKLLNTGKKKRPFSFELIAKFIVDGILKVSPPDEPILLLGYSFGGMLLSEIINQLKERGRIVYAYCIDAAPPITANSYFTSGKVDATKDLIAICDTIAGELNASNRPEKYSDETINSLRTQPITKQLTSIALDYKNADENILSSFNHRANIVEQNMRALLNYNPAYYRQPDAFHVGMTAETLRKYATSADGGWGAYWKSLTNLSSTLLPGTHRTLLSSEHAPAVATDVTGFFTNAFKLQAQATAPIAAPAPTLAVTDSFSSSPQLSATSAFINTELKTQAAEKASCNRSLVLLEGKQNTPSYLSSRHSGDSSLSPVIIRFGLSQYADPLRHSDNKDGGFIHRFAFSKNAKRDEKSTDIKVDVNDVKINFGFNRR